MQRQARSQASSFLFPSASESLTLLPCQQVLLLGTGVRVALRPGANSGDQVCLRHRPAGELLVAVICTLQNLLVIWRCGYTHTPLPTPVGLLLLFWFLFNFFALVLYWYSLSRGDATTSVPADISDDGCKRERDSRFQSLNTRPIRPHQTTQSGAGGLHGQGAFCFSNAYLVILSCLLY